MIASILRVHISPCVLLGGDASLPSGLDEFISLGGDSGDGRLLVDDRIRGGG